MDETPLESETHMHTNGLNMQPLSRPAISTQEPDGPWETGFIKWYDPDRFFGFVTASNGHDAILHKRVVRQCGINPADLTDSRFVRFKSRPVAGRSPEITWVQLPAQASTDARRSAA